MKSKPTCIPFFRARLQKSGRTYFYFEIPDSTRRAEIALGNIKQDAIKHWQSKLFQYRTANRSEPCDLVFDLKLYLEIFVPLLSPLSQRENIVSIQKLVAFFSDGNYGWGDIGSPVLFESYRKWRNPKLSLKIMGELSLLKRVKRELEKLRSQAQPVDS